MTERDEELQTLRQEIAELKEAGRTSKMSKDELKIREIVRDESKRSFTEALSEFFKGEGDDDDEGDEGEAGGNDGGESGSLLGRIGKAFSESA